MGRERKEGGRSNPGRGKDKYWVGESLTCLRNNEEANTVETEWGGGRSNKVIEVLNGDCDEVKLRIEG